MYKKDDKVVFRVGKESFEYVVEEHPDNHWYLNAPHYVNSIIFTKLNIVDRFKFVKGISKYVTDNRLVDFPEIVYPNEIEINKVIDVLLKKCDEYNKQFNNTTTCYNDGDKIVFISPNGQYNYSVTEGAKNHWFLVNDCGYNDRIFVALNITDKIQFCRDISGCEIASGQFPEICCPDSTGISKVINKLMEMCEEKMKESLKTTQQISAEITLPKPIFKVGDYVRVISRQDVKDGNCYRFGFAEEMLKYCGDVCIVAEVSPCYSEAKSEPDDGMLYRLKTISGTLLSYSFASSMLLPTIIVPPQSPFLDELQLKYPLQSSYPFTPSDCVQKIIDSETKTVLKESTPKYKLKFTN